MEQAGLTHDDCVALIGDRARRVTATISVDGGEPVPLAAYACPGGDLLVPTGTDPSLPRSAVSKPVTVEFAGPSGRDPASWTITGTGLAQPLSHHDRPPDDHPQAMLYAFDNGIRVLMARLSAVRAETATLPQQRTAAAPRHRPHSHRLGTSRHALSPRPARRHTTRG